MTKRWPIVVLGLFCLLAFSAAASAECAWVVWEVNWADEAKTKFYTEQWQPRQGFTNAQACVTALMNLTEKEGKTSHFRCLPDTVDPRDPKVK